MSVASLFIGLVLLLGAVGHRFYLDATNRYSPFETHVMTGVVASLGAIFILIGVLLSAAP